MELEQEKKGGPYSKDEREKRQNEVFRLHFEFGYSAVKIADLMNINRNTINDDIKYLYSNSRDELKQDGKNFIVRQIGRLEAQRSRIIENITENKIDDVRYEKLLLDIDKEINNMLLRINSDKITSESVEIQEDVIKDIILFLVIKHSRDYHLKKEDIISEIVNMQHCTMIEAKEIFLRILNLGLECCKKSSTYDLLEFAYLRKYVFENDTFVANVQTMHNLHTRTGEGEARLFEKYIKENGKFLNWTDEVREEYEYDKMIERGKHVEKTKEKISEITVETLKNFPNQEQVQEYAKYINVFFGKDAEIELMNF